MFKCLIFSTCPTIWDHLTTWHLAQVLLLFLLPLLSLSAKTGYLGEKCGDKKKGPDKNINCEENTRSDTPANFLATGLSSWTLHWVKEIIHLTVYAEINFGNLQDQDQCLYVPLTAVNSGGTRRARQATGSASWKNVWEKIAWWKWYSSGLPGLPSKGWLKHPLVAGRLEVWILLQGTQDPGQSLCSGKEKNIFLLL